MKLSRTVAVAVSAAAVLAGSAFPAQARQRGPMACTGQRTGNISGNVVVPAGARCWIHDASVNGAITVNGNGALVVDHARVSGTVTVSGTNPFVAVAQSRIGGLSGTATSPPDQPPGTAGVFLEQADTGTVNFTMMGAMLAVHEVTVHGSLTVTGYGDNWLDTFRVTNALTITTGRMDGPVFMRLPIVTGSATVDTDWSGSVCGGQFGSDLSWAAMSPTVGTNGATCGGNVVKGNLSIVARSLNGPPSAWVSGNVVTGKATANAYYVGGSGNRFLGGADAALQGIQPRTVSDIPAFDFSRQRQTAQQVRNAAR